VRSVEWIDSRPEQKFSPAAISEIVDSRNHVSARVDVTDGNLPALLTFSRAFFRGYQAQIGSEKLRVDSYRGLFPIVEVPAGSHGCLILTYRPGWLICSAVLSILCVSIWLLGLFAATRARVA